MHYKKLYKNNYRNVYTKFSTRAIHSDKSFSDFFVKNISRDDSFTFDFEPNRIPFGSSNKGKQFIQSYSFQFENNRKGISCL